MTLFCQQNKKPAGCWIGGLGERSERMTQQRRERLARRLTLDGAVQWHVLCYQVEPGRIRKKLQLPYGSPGGRGAGARAEAKYNAIGVAADVQCCGCGEQSYVASSQLSKIPRTLLSRHAHLKVQGCSPRGFGAHNSAWQPADLTAGSIQRYADPPPAPGAPPCSFDHCPPRTLYLQYSNK